MRIGRWSGLGAMVLGLSLAGCTSLNLRGEAFPEDETSTWFQQMRRSESLGQSHAFSNKARQIDTNLGGP
jgi:hypothetical protein